MALSVYGVTYVTVKDLVDSLSITRQTLWRWRRERKIPQGQRFRDKRLLFTQSELRQIEAFANHIEPNPGNGLQLDLFGNGEKPGIRADNFEVKHDG